MGTFRNLMHDSRDPLEICRFFDDFHGFTAADWVITTTEAGTGSATEAVADGANGILVLTNAAGDNDLDFLQLVKETFAYEAGKALRFATKFKVSDALDSDVIMGLQVRDTTPLDATDQICFVKADGDNTLKLLVEKDGTGTTLDVCEMVDDTYVEVEFYYDGSGSDIDVFADGARVGSVALTNAPDDEELTISFGIQNGEAAAKVMSVDYILAECERT